MAASREPFFICRACGVSATQLGRSMQVCSGCRARHYCTNHCQQQDWRDGHKQECTILQTLRVPEGLEDGVSSHRLLTVWIRAAHECLAALALRMLGGGGGRSTQFHSHVATLHLACEAAQGVIIRSCEKLSVERAQRQIDRGWKMKSPQRLREMLSLSWPACDRQVWTVIVLFCESAPTMIRLVPQTWTMQSRIVCAAAEFVEALPPTASLLKMAEAASCGSNAPNRAGVGSHPSELDYGIIHGSVSPLARPALCFHGARTGLRLRAAMRMLALTRPIARELLASVEGRRECVALACSYFLAAIGDSNAKLDRAPCSWCGAPTESLCERCPVQPRASCARCSADAGCCRWCRFPGLKRGRT